ncbi:hypothetical protein D7Y15_22740 [Corallococcus sp. AB030]|nr:hypothetical protein D7Y15_22740 [Corallococcus sp. AB030]
MRMLARSGAAYAPRLEPINMRHASAEAASMRVRRALAYLNEAGRVRANLEHLGLTALAARVSSTSCVYAVGSRCPRERVFPCAHRRQAARCRAWRTRRKP